MEGAGSWVASGNVWLLQIGYTSCKECVAYRLREHGPLQVWVFDASNLRLIKSNTLVWFRGMVDDMLGNEFYVGAFKALNGLCSSPVVKLQLLRLMLYPKTLFVKADSTWRMNKFSDSHHSQSHTSVTHISGMPSLPLCACAWAKTLGHWSFPLDLTCAECQTACHLNKGRKGRWMEMTVSWMQALVHVCCNHASLYNFCVH